MLWKAFHILPDAHIAYGKFGKPYLPDYPKAHFNISHSGKYVTCAVSDRPIGIDIQLVGEYRRDVARRACSSDEMEQIESSIDPAAEFTKLWTAKEAYLKMLGCGLTQGIQVPTTSQIRTQQTARYEDTYFSYVSL